jgi:hypothetical protein
MIRTLTNLLVKGGFLPAFCIVSLFAVSGFSQEHPDKIRGYKVYKDKVSVNAATENSDAAVQVGEPDLVDISLAGITLELPAEFTAAKQSGKVEMITFHDLRVNGIKVEPEEYTYEFEFRKAEKLVIPKPVRIFLPASGVVKAAWQEMTDARKEWTVTGRVFVFGKFRRFGFYHKRVVPIDFSLTVKNPLHVK